MSLDYPKADEIVNHPACRWTPRANKVLSTAKAVAGPSGCIEAEHFLLAFEAVSSTYGENVVSRVLDRIGVCPSAALGKPAPDCCPANRYVSLKEFGPSVRAFFPGLVIEEARQMGDNYVGIEHLLLFLARVGVAGVELPYERIRKTIREVMGKS